MVELVKAVGRAIYARLSRDHGKMSDSVDLQVDEATEHFEDRGWPVDETLIFRDNDLSASKFSTKPRPGYLALLAAIRAGQVVLVLVTEVSRLCRNLADAIELVALAKDTPFMTVETTGGARYDLTTIQGEHDFLEAVLDASRESGKSSVRIRRTKRSRAKAGFYNGGGRPFGYRKPAGGKNGTLEVVDSEAAVVRELVDRLLAGDSLRSLVAELNALDIPTATGRRWQQATVLGIVRSPRIKGVRTYYGDEFPAAWPAIISPEEFERLQVVLSDPVRQRHGTTTPKPRSYLLTGLVECGANECGAKLIAGATKATNEPAPKRRYYCRRFDNSGLQRGCGGITRLADPVELAVSEAVLARYESEDLAMLLAPDAPEELHELAGTLVADKARLDEATRDRYRRKDDPLRLDPQRYLAIRNEIEDAMQITMRRMARLEQGRALATIPVGMTLREAWDQADLNWRRTILSLVVVKVVLYPGRPGRRSWPTEDSPLLERARVLGGPWNFDPDPSKIDIEWKL